MQSRQCSRSTYVLLVQPDEFRSVTRAHVIAWRDHLVGRALSSQTGRHRLVALSSLFEYLCERNAVTHNPVKGVKRPAAPGGEGRTPALGDQQARQLLEAPAGKTLKARRDRAMLATLLYHGLRRDELCRLQVRGAKHARRGVPHLQVSGKGGKTRYVPLHPQATGLISEYLVAAGHGGDLVGALFRPLQRSGQTRKGSGALTTDAVYKVVRAYSGTLGFQVGGHALRATAATNALDHEADIAKVQEWQGHASIWTATTRIYDHRRTRAEDSPTFKITDRWGSAITRAR
jgi:integrase/recombinase XerD